MLKIKTWSELLVDKYQIVHHYNKVSLSPLLQTNCFMRITFLSPFYSSPLKNNYNNDAIQK